MPDTTGNPEMTWPEVSCKVLTSLTHADLLWDACRAERMTGPDAEPERVAVKRVNAEDGSVNHKMVEQEVFMLKGLQALRNNSHTVPLYAMHLPDAGHPTDPAYLIMG